MKHRPIRRVCIVVRLQMIRIDNYVSSECCSGCAKLNFSKFNSLRTIREMIDFVSFLTKFMLVNRENAQDEIKTLY